MLNNIFASVVAVIVMFNDIDTTDIDTADIDTADNISQSDFNFSPNDDISEICDLDIAAAEIFDDAPADIKLTRDSAEKLCKMIFQGWWCWMNGETSQTCCEKEVQFSGPHTCCTNANGRVDCYSIPKQPG